MTVLDDAVAQFQTDAALAHQIVHGDANTTVTTAGGSVRSLAKLLADNQAAITTATSYEGLTSIAQAFHQGAVVDAFLYDTSRDSDGGAWRKRCKATSWENERLNGGKWLGWFQDEAAAAAAGGKAGDYFGRGVDGKFWESGYGEVSRGNTREFPALALIVAEAQRIVIYDATKPELPMWMVFVSTANSGMVRSTIQTITALNGQMLVGYGGQSLTDVRFAADDGFLYWVNSTYAGAYKGRVAERNANKDFASPSSARGFIVNATVNDVAITVLPDAPIDPATGLPVPTIAIACSGGVSVLKHDGSVMSIEYTNNVIRTVAFRDKYLVLDVGVNTSNYLSFYDLTTTTSHTNAYIDTPDGARLAQWRSDGVSIPSLLRNAVGNMLPNVVSAGKVLANGGNAGLNLIKENFAAPLKSMVAYITSAFNTGWQVGDSRGAWLADTVAETVTGVELITNGTFDTNLNGWTVGDLATNTWSAGVLDAVSGASSNELTYTTVACVIGKTYTLSYTRGLQSGVLYAAGTNLGTVNDVVGKNTFTFVAVGATATLYFRGPGASSHATFDNVSCKLAVPDRSVKNKGLVINGSITKAAVAAGSQLVGYSGFSAANYLEQAYNSDLDFGTGDFCVMGWVYGGANGTLFERAHNPNQANDLSLTIVAGVLHLIYQGVADANSGTTILANTPGLVGYCRRAGKGYFIYNDQLINVDTGAGATVTSAGAMLRLGCNIPGNYPFDGKMALWRAGATAPSADQIAQIYRDELALFQPGAQATIDGASNVAALAYDDTTDLLHVAVPAGYRSAFKGLQRVSSEYIPAAGVIGSCLSAASGAVITAGGGGARYVQPAMLLRDELRRKDDARRALGKEPVFQEFDAIAAQTTFTLPIGFTTKAVYSAGALKRLGSSKDYTVSSDGYRETITFNAAPGAGIWVSIMCVRA